MTKTIAILAAALMLCCMAQAQIAGVSITGPLMNAVIENHSDQIVIAVNVAYIDAKGEIWRHERLFTDKALGLAPGASEELGTWSKHQKFNTPGTPATISTYAVTAVIFASGELRGDERGDDTGRFMSNMESRLQAMRKVWEMARDGNWSGVQETYDSHDVLGSLTAGRLLMERKKSGPDGAIRLHEHLGKLPQNVWKGGFAARIQHLPGIMDLAAWLFPISVHATNPQFRNVVTWPTTVYDPPHYGSAWVYNCDDNMMSDGCPAIGQTTPFQGIAAECVSGLYEIGVQVQLGVDTNHNIHIQNSGTQLANPAYTLDGQGQCNDELVGTLEGWEYQVYCEGNPSPLIKISDNTGHVCGAGASGWHT